MCSRANPTALSLSAISNADALTGNGLEKGIAVAVCCFIDKTKSFARLRVESRCMLSKSMENVKIKNNISLCFLHREPFRQVVGMIKHLPLPADPDETQWKISPKRQQPQETL